MRAAAWLLALSVAAAANATTLRVDLPQAGNAVLNLPVAVDDAHLADPPGYFMPARPAARVIRSIAIENAGAQPIDNPDIRINALPLLPAPPLATLGVADASDLDSLFPAWRDHVIHATTDLYSARDPATLLHVFGAAYCGNDSRALAALVVAGGGEARFARLNGHSVAEVRSGKSDRWRLLDGDQNLLYLDWDNLTPVGEADILADPLLALRTQVFGRQSAWAPGAAWQNVSRFEYVDKSKKQKTFRIKDPPLQHDWQLLPGERVVIDFTRTPDKALAASDALRGNATLRAAVCVALFHPQRNTGEKVALPWPLASATAGDPVFEGRAGAGAIECQAARSEFPLIRAGENTVESRSAGRLRVVVDYDAPDLKPTRTPSLATAPLRIISPTDDLDRVWWQVSTDRSFALTPPNLDRVSDFTPTLPLQPIDETFLSPGLHFARAKVRHGGVWSDWSKPAAFDVKKPDQPHVIGSEGAGGDQARIRWKPCDGGMLIFGSNRLDFLPEIYGKTEVARMENGAILASQPNRNLLATVPAKDGEACVPVRACYRLVARDHGALSVPSSLLRTRNVPTRVLQTRHEKAEGALTGTDITTVMEIH